MTDLAPAPVREFRPQGGAYERTSIYLPPVPYTPQEIAEMEPGELVTAHLRNQEAIGELKVSFYAAVRAQGRVSPREHARYRERLQQLKLVECHIYSRLGPDFVEVRSSYLRCWRDASKQVLKPRQFYAVEKLAKALQKERESELAAELQERQAGGDPVRQWDQVA